MKSLSPLLLSAAAGVLLLLSACGNKGPLVMPQKPVPIEEQAVPPSAEVDSRTDADRKAQDAVDKPSSGDDNANE